MPTIGDLVGSYLMRPDVIERVKPWEAAVVRTLQVLEGMSRMALAIAQRASESYPSTNYEPYLTERGASPELARRLASLSISLGAKQADQDRRRRNVVEAVRFLAKSGRRVSAIARKAEILLAAWAETSIVDAIFGEAGLSASEFIDALERVTRGEETAYQRVTEIAKVIAPATSLPRGPKVSAASAAHEQFLEGVAGLDGARAYTWNSYEGDNGEFTDPQTEATRREFGLQHFDPRPAHRRLKARQKPKST